MTRAPLPTRTRHPATFARARPGTRRPSTLRRTLLVSALLLMDAGAAFAQEASATRPDGRARALLDLEVQLGRVAGRSAASGGARALVEIRSWLRVGGGVHRVLRQVEDAPERTGPGRGLSLGYAGGVIEADLPWDMLSARVLAGAGIVTLHDLAVDVRAGSDVVGVLRSELVVRREMIGRVALELTAGYLAVFRSDGPGPVTSADLRTPFLGAGLRLGPF